MTTQKFDPKDYTHIIIHLNSPYKWGKGWTESREEYEQFERDCVKIISSLGLTLCERITNSSDSGVNEFGEYMYFHPQEFTGTIRKTEMYKFINCVSMLTSKLFSIKEVSQFEIETNLLPYQYGYSHNPNIIYETRFLPTIKKP